jgi:hypothetical protein
VRHLVQGPWLFLRRISRRLLDFLKNHQSQIDELLQVTFFILPSFFIIYSFNYFFCYRFVIMLLFSYLNSSKNVPPVGYPRIAARAFPGTRAFLNLGAASRLQMMMERQVLTLFTQPHQNHLSHNGKDLHDLMLLQRRINWPGRFLSLHYLFRYSRFGLFRLVSSRYKSFESKFLVSYEVWQVFRFFCFEYSYIQKSCNLIIIFAANPQRAAGTSY